MENDFYRKEYFDQISRDIADLKADMKKLNQKMSYIFGFAAAIGVVSSFLIQWIKSKLS